MRLEVVLPIFIPLLAGTLSVMCWRSTFYQRWIAVLFTAALLASGLWLLSAVRAEGYIVMQMGSWQAPFGITLIADTLGAVMAVLTGLMGLVVAIYSLGSIPASHERFGYYPLMHLLLAGVAGSFLTGDIFNLYVWFEVMLLASFALLTLGGERAQMEGAIKYVTLNLFSSAIFLSSIGLLYGMVGTLNMADIAYKLGQVEHRGMVNVLAVMFMLAFGIKAAAFPLFFWLPASYHTPRVAVSALFAALLTKVGIYSLYRMFTLIFTGDVDYTHTILLWSAGFTMVAGVLGAAAQFEFRRILAFHSVSQIGYMILGLALYTPWALVGGIYYVVHHSLVKTCLFLISGLVYRLTGTYELKELGGVYRRRPVIAILFLIAALSLAGVPPLSGFFAKFIVVRAGLDIGAYALSGIALGVGLLTLFSMIKIWAEVFWKAAPEGMDEEKLKAPLSDANGRFMLIAILMLIAGILLLGFWGQPVLDVFEVMAEQLMDPQGYIEAVLGESPQGEPLGGESL